MLHGRGGAAAIAMGALVAVGAACSGLIGPSTERVDVADDMRALQGTRLEAPPEAIPTVAFEVGGEGTGAIEQAADGVQILYAAPFGVDRRTLQAAVVFDRPMVALSDLDTMNESAPLSCAPAAGKARWAGTSTAVFLPEGGAFPPGTRVACTVKAGAKALDGQTVQSTVSWSFDTPRPRLLRSSFEPRTDAANPAEPITLLFDQPVDPQELAKHLQIVPAAGGDPVALQPPVADPDQPAKLRFNAALVPDSAYVLTVSSGIVGRGGPLGSAADSTLPFRTYPPLRVVSAAPTSVAAPPIPTEWLHVEFSTSVTEEEVARHVKIDPEPDGWDPPDGEYGSRWWGYGVPLRPRTYYTVTLAPGLTDEYGQKLAEPYSWSFTTGDYTPWLTTPGGFALYAANNPKTLPFKQLNAARIDASAATVDPGLVTNPRKWLDAAKARLGDAGARRAFDVTLDAEPNHTEIDTIDLANLLGKGGYGWVATRFSAPNVVDWDDKPVVYDGLMVVTDLGATMKVSPGSTTLWVSSLSVGAPLEGVDVELFVGTERAGTGTTDARGLLRVDGVPKDVYGAWDKPVWARLRKGNDVSVVLQDWDDGMRPWVFGSFPSGPSTGVAIRGFGFADRGIYRLGDPVYARATFRAATQHGLEPVRAQVHWTLDDPDGNAIAEGDGALDARGGFSVETKLPATGRLGDYSVSVLAAGEGFQAAERMVVPVKAYRPAAFRVEMVAAPVAVAGQDVQSTADARYLFGSPMKAGKVHWRSWTEDAAFLPEGWDGWSFAPLVHWWEQSRQDEARVAGDQVTELADGRSSFVQKIEKGYRDRPVNLFLEAEVTDVDRQSVANRTTTLVHPATFYIGLRGKVFLPKVGDTVPVQVVALDPNGHAVVQGVDVKVVQRDWNSVRERGMDGTWRWVNTPVDTPVSSLRIDSSAAATAKGGAAEVTFQPAKPGYYVVRATGKDSLGNDVAAETGLYVTGPGYVGWGRTDENKLELIPDKTHYAVGETARILVKTPAERLQALVTVEREGVLKTDVVTLESTASMVEVPIASAWRPNVYVSVVAVQGAGPQDSPDKGAPSVYAGLVELTIDSDEEHLTVAVRPAATDYRPRDTVEVDVEVQRAGKPVAGAGVTLYAVDEAVLSLTAYETPDAYEEFYARHGLSVRTSDARTAALDRATYLTKGAPRGGGGGEDEEASGPEVRTKFVTTVTWQPDLRTDANGKVHASFPLPDNLTAFRIMAVADSDAVAFGSGQAEVRVNRPLMLRPALPRLLRAGDLAYAGVVVHNATGTERWVAVTATAKGPVEVTGSPATVLVPAGGAREVPFGLRGLVPGESSASRPAVSGEATFEFTASSGREDDALQWPLEVEQATMLETVATSGRIESTVTERIARPDDASPSLGALDVDLATTALVGAGSGLEYLVAYPHECVEQRTSRALGDIVLLQVHDRIGSKVDEEVLKSDVREVLAGLKRYQTGSGGMAYWAGSSWDSTIATAYVVELLGRAKDAGFEVDPALLDSSVDYLRKVLSGYRRADWTDSPKEVALAGKAYVASALARAGQGDAGLNNELFGQRRDLSVFATASLLEAIARTSGADRRTDELAKSIASRSYVEAASASVKENQTGTWGRLWGSDDLSTAAALEALVVSGQQDTLAPRYALHLASSRVGDRWANTRATAGVLAALAAYAEKYEAAAGGQVGATVTLAGKELWNQPLAVPGSASVVVPMGDVQNGDLVFGATNGALYYQTRLQYAPKTLVPRDEGFTLTRALELVEGGPGVVTTGAQVRVTLTVVTPVVRHDVALVDRIPAGFEPVDGSLATASKAPGNQGDDAGGDEFGYYEGDDEEFVEEGWLAMPEYGGSAVFDHHETDDAEVRLYATYMPPGVHTWRYLVRATTPGTFSHPPATVEEMYEPENFGRTGGGTMTIALPPESVAAAP